MLSQYQDSRAAEITQDKAELHTPMQLYLFMVADIYIYIYFCNLRESCHGMSFRSYKVLSFLAKKKREIGRNIEKGEPGDRGRGWCVFS